MLSASVWCFVTLTPVSGLTSVENRPRSRPADRRAAAALSRSEFVSFACSRWVMDSCRLSIPRFSSRARRKGISTSQRPTPSAHDGQLAWAPFPLFTTSVRSRLKPGETSANFDVLLLLKIQKLRRRQTCFHCVSLNPPPSRQFLSDALWYSPNEC